MQKFQLRRAADPLPARPLAVVIYGHPGLGKTSLSGTAPAPVLHFDFDNGIDRSSPVSRPDSFAVSSYREFAEFVMSDEFGKMISEGGYKTVVIDTVGTMLEEYIAPAIIRESAKNGNAGGGLSLQGWGALTVRFTALKARLAALGVNVVFVCHAKEESETDTVKVTLAVKGGTSDIVLRSADLVGFMQVRGDKRIISFQPSESHLGKNPCGLQDMQVPPPENPAFPKFLANIFAEATAAMTAASAAGLELKALATDWGIRVDGCKTGEDFTTLVTEAASVPQQAQQMIKALILKGATDAGFEWDKKAKSFIAKNG